MQAIEYPEQWKNLNVALCHDWLTGVRGGERVLELLCEGFPNAPIFTLIHNASAMSEVINRHPVHTTWLQNMPGIFKSYRYYLPAFPGAIESHKVENADVVISTSHCVAKGLKSSPDTRHVCYCFTPMRYAWVFYDEYFGANPMKRLVLKPMLNRVRDWDLRVSDRVDRFVAISHHVRKRIEKYYNREADVVYPPVNTDYFTPGAPSAQDFDLIVSALVPYKKVDLAVEAYTKSGHALKVVGTGTEFEKLKLMAGANIEFLGWQSDEAIRDLYRACRFLIFPGEEDFGIVPLEVAACGRPVVAFGRGGTLETIKEGDTGMFFQEQTVESLLAGVEKAAGQSWDSVKIRSHSELFGNQRFINEIAAVIS